MIGKHIYSEAYAVILALGEDYINRIPEDVWEFIKEQSDEHLMPFIDSSKGLSEQGLSKKGLAMIAMLRINYLCNSEEEKANFLNYLETNEYELNKILMSTSSMREILKLIKEN